MTRHRGTGQSLPFLGLQAILGALIPGVRAWTETRSGVVVSNQKCQGSEFLDPNRNCLVLWTEHLAQNQRQWKRGGEIRNRTHNAEPCIGAKCLGVSTTESQAWARCAADCTSHPCPGGWRVRYGGCIIRLAGVNISRGLDTLELGRVWGGGGGGGSTRPSVASRPSRPWRRAGPCASGGAITGRTGGEVRHGARSAAARSYRSPSHPGVEWMARPGSAQEAGR